MINFPNLTLNQEKFLRDAHVNPHEQPIDGLIKSAMASAYQRAQTKYKEVAESGTDEEKAALPIYTDTEAMCLWLMSLSDYQSAFQRDKAERISKAQVEADQKAAELAKVQEAIDRESANKDALVPESKFYDYDKELAKAENRLTELQGKAESVNEELSVIQSKVAQIQSEVEV